MLSGRHREGIPETQKQINPISTVSHFTSCPVLSSAEHSDKHSREQVCLLYGRTYPSSSLHPVVVLISRMLIITLCNPSSWYLPFQGQCLCCTMLLHEAVTSQHLCQDHVPLMLWEVWFLRIQSCGCPRGLRDFSQYETINFTFSKLHVTIL